MKQITFKDIHTYGNIVNENDQIRHLHYPDMLSRYDSNFIEFKSMPSLAKFIEVESYLRDFHLKNGQNHVKYTFPDSMKLTDELSTYLIDSGYSISFLELYMIKPQDFPVVNNNPNIVIQAVTDNNLEDYMNLQYKHDLQFGREFADEKASLIKRQFKSKDIKQVLAYYRGLPVGYLDIIISGETVEIDNLMVEEAFQRKGIGSMLQKFVMESFPNKLVILVADGEDTPREMYKKQNYQYKGFKYEALKVFQD